ncbi:MAG: 50S ribosomal protein L11 methyltransferase [Eubacteriaceae bacterium]|nr:50S ribosomal protein L11 methyltransferase [Eubacteriaceae bacterium]
MFWHEVTIYTSKEDLEPLAESLVQIGMQGAVIYDPDEAKQFLSERSDGWDMLDEHLFEGLGEKPKVTVYLPEGSQGMQILNEIKTLAESFASSEIAVSSINDEDWQNSWKRFFKPIKVGSKLLVKPAWEAADPEGRIVISIDPSNSFGSGTHESTQLCLAALEDNVLAGMSVLDVGCGSGILSSAAALLGASSVLALDIDEASVNTTINTAKLNNVDNKIRAILSDLLKEASGVFDLVVANIFADVIATLAGQLEGFLKAGGLFISSGIIMDGLELVLDAYRENGIEVLEIREQGNWLLVVGRMSDH